MMVCVRNPSSHAISLTYPMSAPVNQENQRPCPAPKTHADIIFEQVTTPKFQKQSSGGGRKSKNDENRKSEHKTGAGSKSSVANHWMKGSSDDKIEELKSTQKQAADVKGQWSDNDKLTVVKYITSDRVWTNFQATKAKDFIHARSLRLFACDILTSLLDCTEAPE
jgi:hypothetical protein